jgi:hypothetical protein
MVIFSVPIWVLPIPIAVTVAGGLYEVTVTRPKKKRAAEARKRLLYGATSAQGAPRTKSE